MQQRPDWHGEGLPGALWRAPVPTPRVLGMLQGLLARWRGRRVPPVPAGPGDGLAPDRALSADAPPPFEGEARAYAFAMAGRLVAAHRHGARACGVADAMAYGQAVQMLDAALARLPERSRQVFLRRQVNGEGEAALASEYAVPLGVIESDVRDAQQGMRSALQGWRPQKECVSGPATPVARPASG